MTPNRTKENVLPGVGLSISIPREDCNVVLDENVVPSGVWAGTYNVGKESGFVRMDLVASAQGDQPSNPDSPVRITAALEEGGNAPPAVLTFDAANHSIRVTETGKPSEVLREIRFVPGYFEAKTDWIWSVVG